jgi:hypothetical protein
MVNVLLVSINSPINPCKASEYAQRRGVKFPCQDIKKSDAVLTDNYA